MATLEVYLRNIVVFPEIACFRARENYWFQSAGAQTGNRTVRSIALADPAFIKPIDNPSLISVLCMTRGRPEMLTQSIEAAAERVADPANVDMWIYVDEDDDATRGLINTPWMRSIPFSINWLVLQRPRTLPEGFNELWRRSGNASLYMGLPDDYAVVTQNWDAEIRATMFEKSANEIAIGNLCDPLEPNLTIPTFMVETAQWANFTGQFLNPFFPFWFGDTWLQQIAGMVNQLYYIDVGVLPLDGDKGKTQNMRDLYFWRRFFQLLLVERIDIAQRILDHIHPLDSPTRADAVQFMKNIINEIEGDMKRMPNKLLNAVEAKLSGESGPPSERYLETLRAAKDHLREMAPRIKKYNTERILRSKIMELTAEILT